jgi:hypothetical protein
VVTTLYLFFLAQTLLRLRLMDLHELLGKVASQTVLAVMLAAVFLVLTAWVKGNTSLYLFNTVLAAFVIGILLEPLRAKVEAQVVHIFFRERSELLRSLAALRTRLANVIDPGEATAVILDALEETRRVTHASVYLLAEDRPGFQRLNFRGPRAGSPSSMRPPPAACSPQPPSGQKALLLEKPRAADHRDADPTAAEGRRSREELKRTLDTRNALLGLKSAFTVPLVGGDRVVGFLNLWDERVPEAVRLRRDRHGARGRRAPGDHRGEQQALRAHARARPARRARRDGGGPRSRDPQSTGSHQGSRPVPGATAPRRRGGRVPRRHRRGGESPQRRGDPVPRLRPAR